MRLWEAMLLGNTLIRPRVGVVLAARLGQLREGCALGMAARAVMDEQEEQLRVMQLEHLKVHSRISAEALLGSQLILKMSERWPVMLKRLQAPCSCRLVKGSVPFGTLIAHLFDFHVAGGKQNWTFDRLVTWVLWVETFVGPPTRLLTGEVAPVSQEEDTREEVCA